MNDGLNCTKTIRYHSMVGWIVGLIILESNLEGCGPLPFSSYSDSAVPHFITHKLSWPGCDV